MQNYNLTQIGEPKTIFKNKVKTFQLHKKNKNEITPKEIQNLYKTFLEKAKPNTKLRIRGLGIDKYATITYGTLKNMNDDNLDILDYEEYYEGKVKDSGKFKKFSQLEFTIYEPE